MNNIRCVCARVNIIYTTKVFSVHFLNIYYYFIREFLASMIAKIRITTEEEAKAALAERRRLAREQAEREAELERLRQVCHMNLVN